MVSQVASGPQQTVALCKDEQGSMVIQMGSIKLIKEEFLNDYPPEGGAVMKSNKNHLEEISSLPF